MRNALLLLILSLPLTAGAGDALKRYQIRSGHIEYTVTGSQAGTETLSWTDWGARELRETHTAGKIMGIPQKRNAKSWLLGTWQYELDLDSGRGTKMQNPMLANMEKDGGDPQQVGENMLKSMGGEKTGSDSVLGRPCEVWEIRNLGSKICVWKGVALRSDISPFGMMQQTILATRIEENASLPDSRFQPPGDVTFTETSPPATGGQDQPQVPDLKEMFKGFGRKK